MNVVLITMFFIFSSFFHTILTVSAFQEENRLKSGEFLLIPPSPNIVNPDNTRTSTQEFTVQSDHISYQSGSYAFSYLFPENAVSWKQSLPSITNVSLKVYRLDDFVTVAMLELVRATPPNGTPEGYIAFSTKDDAFYAFQERLFSAHQFIITITFAPKATVTPSNIPETDYPIIYTDLLGSTDGKNVRWARVSPPSFAPTPATDRFGKQVNLLDQYHVNLRPGSRFSSFYWNSWHWAGFRMEGSLDHTMFGALDVTFPIMDWFLATEKQSDNIDGIVISIRGPAFLEPKVGSKCQANGLEAELLPMKYDDSKNKAQRQALKWFFSQEFKQYVADTNVNSIRIVCSSDNIVVVYPSNISARNDSFQFIVEPFKSSADGNNNDLNLDHQNENINQNFQFQHHRGVHFISYSNPDRPTSKKDLLNAISLSPLRSSKLDQIGTSVAPPCITRVWEESVHKDAGKGDVVVISTQFLAFYTEEHLKQSPDIAHKEFPDHIAASVNAIMQDDKDAVVYGVISPLNVLKKKEESSKWESYTFTRPLNTPKTFLFEASKFFEDVPDSLSWGYHVSIIATGKFNRELVVGSSVNPLTATLSHFSSTYNTNPKQHYDDQSRPMTPPTIGIGHGTMDLERLLTHSEQKGEKGGWEIDMHSTQTLQFRMKWTSPDPNTTETDISNIFVAIPGWRLDIDGSHHAKTNRDWEYLKIFDAKGVVIKTLKAKDAPTVSIDIGIYKVAVLETALKGSMIQIDLPWVKISRPTWVEKTASIVNTNSNDEILEAEQKLMGKNDRKITNSDENENTPHNTVNAQKDDKPGDSTIPIHFIVSVGDVRNTPSISFNYNQKALPLTSRGNKNGSLGWIQGKKSGSVLLVICVVIAIIGLGLIGIGIFMYLKKKRDLQQANQYSIQDGQSLYTQLG